MIQQLYLMAGNDRLIDLLLLQKQGLITAMEKEELRQQLLLPEAMKIYALFCQWDKAEMLFYSNT